MITNRDAIVGSWQGPLATLGTLLQNSTQNLERWEPWVRAAVFDFEMFSCLHMTRHLETYATQASSSRSFTLWHTNVTPGAGVVPVAKVRRVVSFKRPRLSVFRRQLDFVYAYADLRPDRASEIAAQIDNAIPFWTSIANLHPNRTKWTLELLGAALRLASFAEQRFKHALACRRPLEFSPQVQPMMLTPGHGALPSGHSTEAHIVAYVLWKLIKPATNRRWCDQLMRQAARIAINRTVAGVHFPVDSSAGQLLGLTLGDYLVHRCGGKLKYRSWRFDGERYLCPQDFDWRMMYRVSTDTRLAPAFTDQLAQHVAAPSALLSWLWNKAKAEWI